MTTPQVQHGAPLEALDFYAYLAGVLIDPATIDYMIVAASGGLPIVDEDLVPVSGVTPRRVQEGIYDAGVTVLSPDTPAGDYVITWNVQKIPAGPVISRSVPFELVDALAVDPEQEGQSRRDIPDTAYITQLRTLVKDNAPDDTAWAFFNSELQALIEAAVVQHTAGARALAAATADDIAMAMMLAQCDVLSALATEMSRYFRWTDGNESVDKTQTPIALTNTCRAIMDKYNKLMTGRRKDDELGTTGPRGRDLMRWRPRQRRRR